MGRASAASEHSAGQITETVVGNQQEEERIRENLDQVSGACYNEERGRDG